MKNSQNKARNPFLNQDEKQVWKQLLANSKPITKESFLAKMAQKQASKDQA
ncbi:MAG: hypothetical protein MUE53_07095 [Chitinophagales bacterium]|jgi:hypothetical protein|nr:hypothetical protein [Chitinophagales bacterium]